MWLRDLLTPTHLLVILVVYLLFFGTRKLPQLGKNLGEGIIGLKEAFREAHKAAAGEPETPAAAPQAQASQTTAQPTKAPEPPATPKV
jgi:sec-independent protein translocase protein TatA